MQKIKITVLGCCDVTVYISYLILLMENVNGRRVPSDAVDILRTL